MITFKPEQFRRIGIAILEGAGASKANAERTIDSLISASLAGHDSHGIIRIVQYTEAIEKGHIAAAAQPSVVQETPSTALVDGNWTFGQVAAEFAMNLAIEKARLHGISLVGLIRSYHIGRLGEYSEMASAAGMIGLILAGGFGGTGGRSSAGVAPYGGARAVFSTNPLSFGIPAGNEPPVMVDFATSAVAGGKISLARAKGEHLPPNCILDSQGRPTTDPEDFFNGGMMMPFGGHKGYGLAVVIELLGQALTGSEAWAHEKMGGEGVYSGAGSLFISIDPTVFRQFDEFTQVADHTIERIKAVPPAPGFDEVLLPGEPERRNTAKRQEEGITMADGTWATTRILAEKYNVDVDSLMK